MPSLSRSPSPERPGQINAESDHGISEIKYGKKNLDGTLRHLTWAEWYDEKLAEAIPGNIDEKLNLLKVPRPLSAFIIGTFFLGSFAIVLLYTYIGVTNAMGSYYMSLDTTDGSQVCYEVPTIRRGKFLVDHFGHWDTDSHSFSTNMAVYELDFQGTLMTTHEYTAAMNKFRAKMEFLGERCASRDLAWNLMAWATWTVSDEVGLHMYTMADTGIIFSSLQVVSFHTYSYHGKCIPHDDINCPGVKGNGNCLLNDVDYHMPDSIGSISRDGKSLTFSYDMELENQGGTRYKVFDYRLPGNGNILDGLHYIGDSFSPCPEQFNPVHTWTYNVEEFEHSNFHDMSVDITLDLRSIYTAIAVNFGILHIDDLTEVKEIAYAKYRHWLLDDFPEIKYFIDVFYAPVEPIACVSRGTEISGVLVKHDFCVVPLHSNFVYPVLWSKSDATYSSDEYCECEKLSGPPTDPSMHNEEEQTLCHSPFMQIAFVYDKVDVFTKRSFVQNNIKISWPVFELGTKYAAWIEDDPKHGDIDVIEELQKVLVAPTNSSGDIPVFQSICPRDDCGVGIWTIHPDPTNLDSNYITIESLELKDLSTNVWTDAHGYTVAERIACEDTIYSPQAAAWDSIVNNPPVALVEPFNECSSTFFQAFSDSFGNATGTASTFMMIWVFFLIFCTKQVLNRNRPAHDKLRHPKVQTIYDQEQQEIQQAKLSLAFKKLLEVGKFDEQLPEFSDFLEDYESRMDDQNFNKALKQEYDNGMTQEMMDEITEERRRANKKRDYHNDLTLDELKDISDEHNELDDVPDERKHVKMSRAASFKASEVGPNTRKYQLACSD